jgi:hypothetical protein
LLWILFFYFAALPCHAHIVGNCLLKLADAAAVKSACLAQNSAQKSGRDSTLDCNAATQQLSLIRATCVAEGYDKWAISEAETAGINRQHPTQDAMPATTATPKQMP